MSRYGNSKLPQYKHTDPKTGEIFIGEKVGGPAIVCFKTNTYGTEICLKRTINGKTEHKWVEQSECERK